MTITVMSQHAKKRSQQRGITPFIVDLLLEFGSHESDGDGAEIYFFDRKSKKRIHSYAGTLVNKINEQLDAYIVVAGGTVVTVGKRTKHINHH